MYHFLTTNKYTLILVGIWPIKYDNLAVNIFYKTYSLTIFCFLSIFISTFWVEAYFTPKTKMLELLDTCGLGIDLTVTVVKMVYCSKALAQKLMTEIYEEGVRIKKLHNEVLLNIWAKGVKYNTFICKLIHFLGFLTLSPHITFPLYATISANDDKGNTTLPFRAWVPFDKDKNHELAFTLQTLGGLYGTCAIVSCDAFFFALMIFCACKCRMLQYTLVSFRVDEERNVEFGELEDCVRHHKKIIKLLFSQIWSQNVDQLML